MANHVHNHISVQGNEAALAKFKELFDRVEDDNLDDIFEEKCPDDNWYDWRINNIGAKWATVEDVDVDYAIVVSAWSAVIQACEYISKQLFEIDPDHIITLSAEDEMPNWFGVYIFAEGELYDHTEWDWDELKDILLLKSE